MTRLDCFKAAWGASDKRAAGCLFLPLCLLMALTDAVRCWLGFHHSAGLSKSKDRCLFCGKSLEERK